MSNKETPFYVVPASEPFLRDYDELFLRFAAEDMHTLVLNVHKEMVSDGEVAGLQQIIMALQHQPHLIEKMLFCLDIRFTEIEDSELYLPPTYWKGDVAYYRWFRDLAASPVMLFFINDEDARFYALAGDLLADNELELKPDTKGKKMVGISGEQLEEVMNRLFTSCWWLLAFCHGSGFDPKPYIESVLADLDLPLTYEEVYEIYKEDAKKGINFRTSAI